MGVSSFRVYTLSRSDSLFPQRLDVFKRAHGWDAKVQKALELSGSMITAKREKEKRKQPIRNPLVSSRLWFDLKTSDCAYMQLNMPWYNLQMGKT